MTKVIETKKEQWKYDWCKRLQDSGKIKYWPSMINRTKNK